MSLFQKIRKKYKEKGMLGLIRLCGTHLSGKINDLIYYICWVSPVDKKMIVFESEGDLTDNSFALYDYMRKRGTLGNYKIIWLVNDPACARKYISKEKGFDNTQFIKKFPDHISFARGCVSQNADYLSTTIAMSNTDYISGKAKELFI